MSIGSPVIIYVTCGSHKEAKVLAEGLVSNRLAACVNIIEGVESVYHWQGEIQHEHEWLLMIKSTSAKKEEAFNWVRAHHSYTCPEFIVVPIVDGAPAYLQWMQDYLN